MRSVRSGPSATKGKRFPVFRNFLPDCQNSDQGKKLGHASEGVVFLKLTGQMFAMEKISGLALRLREIH